VLTADCDLDVGNISNADTWRTIEHSPNEFTTETLPLETARTLASGGDVKLNCLDRGFGRVEGADMKITAVNVSSVSVP
jgi:hypothetical protein